eukprot:767364-Hanusia_phi.AAC.4
MDDTLILGCREECKNVFLKTSSDVNSISDSQAVMLLLAPQPLCPSPGPLPSPPRLTSPSVPSSPLSSRSPFDHALKSPTSHWPSVRDAWDELSTSICSSMWGKCALPTCGASDSPTELKTCLEFDGPSHFVVNFETGELRRGGEEVERVRWGGGEIEVEMWREEERGEEERREKWKEQGRREGQGAKMGWQGGNRWTARRPSRLSVCMPLAFAASV